MVNEGVPAPAALMCPAGRDTHGAHQRIEAIGIGRWAYSPRARSRPWMNS